MTPEKELQIFLEIYQEINYSHKRFKERLETSKLPYRSKNLLNALYAFKKEEIDSALNLLEKTTFPGDHFILAYKNLTLGLIYNHIGDYKNASLNLVKSYEQFKQQERWEEIHRPIAVLSMCYFNLKDLKRLKKYYQEFKKINNHGLGHEILDREYRIYISILDQKFATGLNLINELLEKFQQHIGLNTKKYIIFKFMLAIEMHDIDYAYQVAQEYKNAGGFSVKSNYKFMMSLLNFYSKDAKLYIYKKDFTNSPNLYLQLKVIQNLYNDNTQEAARHWQQLQQINPEIYQGQYIYLGGKDLFSLCLEKVKPDHNRKNIVGQYDLSGKKNNMEKLKYLFECSNGSLSKEEIIQLIWNEEWSPETDMKLRSLISRTQRKYSLKIKNLDGKYKKVA